MSVHIGITGKDQWPSREGFMEQRRRERNRKEDRGCLLRRHAWCAGHGPSVQLNINRPRVKNQHSVISDFTDKLKFSLSGTTDIPTILASKF